MSYQWNWGVFFQTTPDGTDTYLGWLLTGMKWTLSVSLSAWVVALIIGTTLGVLRTVPNRWLSGLATAYVELFRNVPLLVQLFIWFYVVPELLPEMVKQKLFAMPPVASQFMFGFIGLGMFTAARVCEQVRSGIESLPKGQKNAGLAMGFTLPQTYRYVLMPMAFRIVIPPMTSEFMNIFKNSAVVSVIGMLELTGQARQLLEYTAHAYESFTAATLGYFLINVIVMYSMRWLENRTRVPGYMGGK
ncbi:glutamate/aspartate transport system permease protein [Chitinivorax tropicus]|uniref:Glutamate/aspartate transport system permease protein n=1 Tax=Chitinivorax tropicus TaxID=714531 RepID=A0A840MJC9_9PROT|nr:amino acid ABC transporter permease [Chitinivorax tropicus]MBB5017289.1 glutamate/aspartate transport system permease protein [Chitinivorax tropicus]